MRDGYAATGESGTGGASRRSARNSVQIKYFGNATLS
jgi:hypothetical protein